MGNQLSEHGGGKLKKSHVGLFALVGMYYAEICSGAFGIEEMIPEAGPGMTMLLLVVLAVVWAFPISFVCSELGSARPDEGGVLVWIKEAMGEFWYGIALVCMTIWGLVANAVYIVLAVSYLGELIYIPPMAATLLKVGLVIFFFFLNVKGVREMGLFSAILTVAIILAFAAVTVVGLMNWNRSPVTPFIADEEGGMFRAFGAGLGVALWMYCGFEQISMMSGEIQDAHRMIPKALMVAIPIISLTYILPTLGGRAAHTICSVIVLVICVLVTVVSGVDYFFGGLIAILLLPVFYVIFKKRYGGCTVNEPREYPRDPRTRLAFGDYTKIGAYLIGVGIYSVVSRFFLEWYEGPDSAEYYLEEYETGIFSDMSLMFSAILIIGAVCVAVGAIALLYGRKLDRDGIPSGK